MSKIVKYDAAVPSLPTDPSYNSAEADHVTMYDDTELTEEILYIINSGNENGILSLFCEILYDNNMRFVFKKLDFSEKILQKIDLKGNTLLHHAARVNDFDLVNFLLERGFDPNAVNEEEELPITSNFSNIGQAEDLRCANLLLSLTKFPDMKLLDKAVSVCFKNSEGNSDLEKFYCNSLAEYYEKNTGKEIQNLQSPDSEFSDQEYPYPEFPNISLQSFSAENLVPRINRENAQ